MNKAPSILGLKPITELPPGNRGSVIDYPQGQNGLPVLQAMNITTHLEAFLTKQQLGRCKKSSKKVNKRFFFFFAFCL